MRVIDVDLTLQEREIVSHNARASACHSLLTGTNDSRGCDVI